MSEYTSLLSPGWDATKEGDNVLGTLVNVCAPEVKGAHDADFVIVGDTAYVVYLANDQQPAESPYWPFVYCALSVVNIQTGKVEQVIPFASSENAYANVILPVGACFVPRILQIDDKTLRCFWASENPEKRQSQTWYRDFDCQTRRFADEIHKARIKTSAGTFDMQPCYLYQDAVAQGLAMVEKDYGLYPIDGFKEYDGEVYAVLNNFPIGQNALARLTPQMDVFEVLGHFIEPLDLKLSEAAAIRFSDGHWQAISRCENSDMNYRFTSSPDGKKWTPHETCSFVSGGTNSKPTFDCFNGIYYLGWQDSRRVNDAFRSVFHLDVSTEGRNWERKYTFATEKAFQYPVFRTDGKAIYLAVTQGDHSDSRKERIMFGKLEELA